MAKNYFAKNFKTAQGLRQSRRLSSKHERNIVEILALSDLALKEKTAAEPQGADPLVIAAQAGDRAAFASLVARDYDFIYAVAFKWLGNQADAEDVTQDVCIKLAKAIRSFAGRASFRSWLYRIVLNAANDLGRKKSRRRETGGDAGEIALSQIPVAPVTQKDQDNKPLWSAVRSLPERQRDAVLLVYAEDKNHAEAAAIMECSEGTVSYHLFAARKALKAHLVRLDND